MTLPGRCSLGLPLARLLAGGGGTGGPRRQREEKEEGAALASSTLYKWNFKYHGRSAGREWGVAAAAAQLSHSPPPPSAPSPPAPCPPQPGLPRPRRLAAPRAALVESSSQAREVHVASARRAASSRRAVPRPVRTTVQCSAMAPAPAE